MPINPKLAHILSDFFLDIAKAWFIATFVTPNFISINPAQLVGFLIKGTFSVMLYLLLAYQFSKLEK